MFLHIMTKFQDGRTINIGSDPLRHTLPLNKSLSFYLRTDTKTFLNFSKYPPEPHLHFLPHFPYNKKSRTGIGILTHNKIFSRFIEYWKK